MASVHAGELAALAWVVAIAMAAAIGAAVAALASHRRGRRAERRLRQLESAVAEFYAAFRARLDLERARRQQEQ